MEMAGSGYPVVAEPGGGGGRYLYLAQRKYFIVNYKRLQF